MNDQFVDLYYGKIQYLQKSTGTYRRVTQGWRPTEKTVTKRAWMDSESYVLPGLRGEPGFILFVVSHVILTSSSNYAYHVI